MRKYPSAALLLALSVASALVSCQPTACSAGNTNCDLEVLRHSALYVSADGGDGQTGNTGATLARSLEVQYWIVSVEDITGRRDSTVERNITINWTVGQGSGTVDHTETLTDATGKTRVTWTLGPTVGQQTVRATVNGAPAATVLFTATAQAPPASCSGTTSTVSVSDNFASGSQWTKEISQVEGTTDDAVEQQAAGGNPDGYRRMIHTLGPPAGASGASYRWVVHLYTGATYDPSIQGEVCQLIYQEDQIDFSTPIQVMWGAVVKQDGKTFIYRPDPQFNSATWVTKGPYGLTPANFTPAPGPNFSPTGKLMQFGYVRANSTSLNPTAQQTITHGIDNWRFDIVHK